MVSHKYSRDLKESRMGSRILRIRDLMDEIGVSKATLYRMVSEGSFPPPVKIAKRAVGWRREDVDRWLESREPVSAT